MKKNKLALLLALSIASLSVLGGCSGEESSSSSAAASSAAAGATELSIGVIQVQEHPSLDTIRTSTLATLEEELGDGYTLQVDYQNAQGDQSNLTTIAQKFATDDKDLIIAIATPSAQAAARATTEIPIVFSAVTDPAAAGFEIREDGTIDGNVTGTSDDIPVEQVFALAEQLTPEVQSYGFVYNIGEPNSVSVIERAKAYCDENGIPYVESTITNTSEVQQAVQSAADRADALFTTIDNTVATAMVTASQVATDAGKPFYVGADSMVMDGGFATVGIDYTVLGEETGKMAAQVLTGTPTSEIPVKTLDNFSTIINLDTANALGITIPEDILESATVITGEEAGAAEEAGA